MGMTRHVKAMSVGRGNAEEHLVITIHREAALRKELQSPQLTQLLIDLGRRRENHFLRKIANSAPSSHRASSIAQISIGFS